MPTRPFNRKPHRTREDDEGITASIQRLLSIGPYDRNQITRDQIDRLRDLVDRIGGPLAAEQVGVGELALMRACAGFGHRLRAETGERIRKYLAGRRAA